MKPMRAFDRVVFAHLDEPPFCTPVPGGAARGCDVDVAVEVLRAIGVVHIETKLVTFAQLLPGIAAGQWHINTPLFVTDERKRVVDFSRPVWALADGLMVRAGERRLLDGYEALAAADGARLAVVAGQVQEERAIVAGVTPDRVLRVATQAEAVEAVIEKRADAYASVAMAHRGYLHARPDDRLRVMDFAAGGGAVAIGAYAFSKQNSDLRTAFDEQLHRLLGTQVHREIMRRYGFSDSDIDRVI
jgi:polar amino acid transport system substrate-binding protein